MTKVNVENRSDIHAVELLAKLFRGLGDSSRLSILSALRTGPLAVGEIVGATGLSQPNASNHLRCLSDCGLVTSEQRGRYVYYQLADKRIAGVVELAAQLLDSASVKIDICRNYRL